MPRNWYSRPLKVSTPEGERIIANIQKIGDHIVIEISKYIEAVKKDNPPFAKHGFIGFSCTREKYKETMAAVARNSVYRLRRTLEKVAGAVAVGSQELAVRSWQKLES